MDEYRTIDNIFGQMRPNVSDPIHAMMLSRKKHRDRDEVIPQKLEHQNEDSQQLEEFCKQHGILGFNCGHINPKTALRLLKAKLGIVDSLDYNNTKTNKNLLLD